MNVFPSGVLGGASVAPVTQDKLETSLKNVVEKLKEPEKKSAIEEKLDLVLEELQRQKYDIQELKQQNSDIRKLSESVEFIRKQSEINTNKISKLQEPPIGSQDVQDLSKGLKDLTEEFKVLKEEMEKVVKGEGSAD